MVSKMSIGVDMGGTKKNAVHESPRTWDAMIWNLCVRSNSEHAIANSSGSSQALGRRCYGRGCFELSCLSLVHVWDITAISIQFLFGNWI